MEHLLAANYQMFAVDHKNEPVTPGMYKCEGLFADFIRKFSPGHGQMKSVLTETDRSAKPSVFLSAPDVQFTDEVTAEITQSIQKHCLGDDPFKRRRYALIIYQNFAFIVGGYDFDTKNRTRSQPLHDFVYDIGKKVCRGIPSIPSPGRVAFGIAPSERYIIIIGGHTYDNIALSSVFVLDTQNIDRGWEKFPSYPHPILAPGVAFTEDRVIVIGGYDIILGETEMLPSHYQMDIHDKVWRRYADLNPPRARSLVICIYNQNAPEVYAAGGYTVVDGKAQVVDKIYAHNLKKDRWSKLTDIPHFRIDQGIAIAHMKLIISEEVPGSNGLDHPSSRPVLAVVTGLGCSLLLGSI